MAWMIGPLSLFINRKEQAHFLGVRVSYFVVFTLDVNVFFVLFCESIILLVDFIGEINQC